jgi:hypothetical protein
MEGVFGHDPLLLRTPASVIVFRLNSSPTNKAHKKDPFLSPRALL